MSFYSRINNNGDKELLEEHLQKVSSLCGDFCSEFTKREIGEFLGWLHDAGKMTERFQNVLNKKETNVNHAVVGGIIGNINESFIPFCQTDKETMKMITDIIISHHSEIKQNNGDKSKPSSWEDTIYDKKYAVSSDEELKEICKYYALKINDGTINRLNYKIQDENFDNLEKMLFERMLLSCLVDADYSSSAMFFKEDYLENTELQLNTNSELYKLEKYRNNLIAGTNQTHGMNAIRSWVYRDCSVCPEINNKVKGGLFKLTAPTGSAKTLGMVKWGLLCAEKYNKKRIFTVLPFLSVISQTVEIYKNIFGDDVVLEDDSQVEHLTEKERELTSRWTSPFIIPTMVKFLEGLFVCGAANSRRLHNICNSVILLDEFQSIPPHLLNVTLCTLRELARKYGCIVLFSSATLPNFSTRKGLEWWDDEVVEIIKDVDGLYNAYGKAKEINISWELKRKYSIKEMSKKISLHNNSCCIVNTKKAANKIYCELIKLKNKQDCFLVTTNLCNKHREKIIQEIKYRQKNKLPVYIVATQCIEAGVDTSSEFLYREIAPLEAIIQSSGRCARNGECIGKMTVFVLDDTSTPDISYYNAKEQTRVLYESNENDIDINKLKYLSEYYEDLWKINGFEKDKQALVDAIYSNENFIDTKEEYKVIDNNEQLRIVVPYDTREYQEFVNEYMDNSSIVTMKSLKKIQSITVSTFDTSYKAFIKPILIKTTHHPEGISNNIFLLLKNTVGVEYDEKIGLTQIENNNDFIF